MKEIKAPIRITTDETIKYFADNIQAVRDTIYVNVFTEEDFKTESGLIVKGKAYNEPAYTILAVGEATTGYIPGEKVYLKIRELDTQMINGHKFAIVSPFHIIAKKK
jgi:co-chaperonin GroES (HSP10)